MKHYTLGAVAAWGLALSGSTAVALAATVPLMTETVGLSARTPVRLPSPSVGYPADSIGRSVVKGDPFRVSRRPTDVPYDPLRVASSGAAATGAPKPSLVLTGIVWGATPQAVMEGLPGVDRPRVLRTGDVVAGLCVKRIEPTRVTVVGLDTVWVLTVRQPW